MKNKRKIRVMAWILTVVMLMTSLGLDALPVMAADAGSFTYEVSFDASFTTAEMTFTLQTIQACFFGYKVPVSAADTGDNL